MTCGTFIEWGNAHRDEPYAFDSTDGDAVFDCTELVRWVLARTDEEN